MPIYEYLCQDCRTSFELIRPMREADAPIACCDCCSPNTTRKLSRFNAHSEGRVVTHSGGGCGCGSGGCGNCSGGCGGH